MIVFGRIMTIAMFAGIAFLLIVPLALRRHQTALAIGISVLFFVYLAMNIVLWRRMKRRS